MSFLDHILQYDPEIETNFVSETQRTDDWFEARRGRFTGSRIKDLMSCDRSAAKMEWGRPEKLLSLGEAAKKYIFEKAKERQRNKVVKTASTKAMNYGTENEDVVIQLLQEKYPNLTFESVGFIEIIPGVLGASPDGVVIKKNGNRAGLEIKCATGWDGLYNREIEAIDQSHLDFWQLQTEMMALKVTDMMYVVAEPSESIFEPNITDLSIMFVKASPIHQNCIIQRAKIGDAIIRKYLEGMPFLSAVEDVCSNFEIK